MSIIALIIVIAGSFFVGMVVASMVVVHQCGDACDDHCYMRKKKIQHVKNFKKPDAILYMCDGKACDRPSTSCGTECFHTTDVRHARNFDPQYHNEGQYWERKE